MFVRTLALVALLGGCAGSVDRVRGLVADAPDWYTERRVEIRGEGYPNVAAIPRLDADTRPGTDLNVEQDSLGMAEVAFLAHPRAEPASPTSTEEIYELQASLMARFDPVSTPPNILTDEEIEALRSVFDKYTAGG